MGCAARRLGHAAALLLAVSAAAGCGGGDPEYRPEPTRDCLVERGVDVDTTDVGFVASSAGGGALHAEFTDNEVTIAFGEDEEDADRVERAQRRFSKRGITLEHVLKRRRNAVILWGIAPTPSDENRVMSCLSS